MSAFIPLCPQVKLQGKMQLFMSDSAFPQFERQCFQWRQRCMQLSSLRTVLLYRFWEENTSSWRYVMLTDFGVFLCKRSYQNNFMITYRREDSMNRSNALREGITFQLPAPIFVGIQEEESVFWNFAYGQEQSHGVRIDCSDTFDEIDRAFEARMSVTKEKAQETENAPEAEENAPNVPAAISSDLAQLLDRAEKYADFDYTMTELAAVRAGNIHYSAVDGGTATAQEEQLLRFYFSSYETIRELNTESIVNLRDKTDKILGAEIVGKSEEDEENAYLELSFQNFVELDQIPETGNLTLTVSPVVRDTQLATIQRIREEDDTRKFFEKILGGGKPEGFTDEDLTELKKKLTNRKYPMTDMQIQAVIKGITTKDACLIMGPPGTGKTSVILEWAKYFALEKHQRVLIASQNNTAVDNVLKRLHETPGFDILRIGKATKVAADISDLQLSHKLTVAREKICAHSQSRQEAMIRLYDHWTQIYEAVGKAGQAMDSSGRFMETFAPFARDLARRHQEIVEAAQRLAQYRKKILALADKVTKIGAGKGLRSLIPGWIRKMGLQGKKRVLYTALRREKEMQNNINQLIGQYNRYSRMLYEEKFLPSLNENGLSLSPEETIRQLYERDEDFFPFTPEQFRVTGSKQVQTLIKSIADGLGKLDATIQALQQWQRNVKNTQNYALQSLVLENVNVVGATCISSGKKSRFSNIKYDVTIIDEAGQIKIHDCLVPMGLSKKLIMLGDHKQLPPMASRELVAALKANGIDTELYQNSLFEHMYDNFPEENKRMLDTQFRIPQAVADFLSERFYKGLYQTSEAKKKEQFCLDFLSSYPMVLIDTSDSADRFQYPRPKPEEAKTEEERSRTKKIWNPYESRLIAKLYQKLKKQPYAAWETKILAGLNAQVQTVRETLAQEMGRPVPGAVSTVDSFQGQECDVIIYSFTRSVDLTTADENALQVGFLSDLRRLNVAMSRAKKVLVIVGDFSYLNAQRETLRNSTKKNRKFADFVKALLATAQGDTPSSQIISSGELLRKLEVPEL